MQKTNYLAKARQLLAKSASATALVIIPLAAAAAAQAAPTFDSNTVPTYAVLPTGNFSCSATGDGSTVPCGGSTGDASLSIPGSGGVQGISFFTVGGAYSIPASSGATATLKLGAGGVISMALNVNPPINYDFTLSQSSITITTWSLVFKLGTSLNDATYGSFSANGNGAGHFTGGGTLTLLSHPAASSTLWETVVLTVNSTSGGAGSIGVLIPQGSTFDFQSAESVPEPGTVGTLGAGLGIVAWLIRRRKRA